MVKYKVEFEMSILPQDSDLADLIADIIRDRFQGTAVRIGMIEVKKQEKTA
jgi:hypothetical protein